jgi:hypothetical protein
MQFETNSARPRARASGEASRTAGTSMRRYASGRSLSGPLQAVSVSEIVRHASSRFIPRPRDEDVSELPGLGHDLVDETAELPLDGRGADEAQL